MDESVASGRPAHRVALVAQLLVVPLAFCGVMAVVFPEGPGVAVAFTFGIAVLLYLASRTVLFGVDPFDRLPGDSLGWLIGWLIAFAILLTDPPAFVDFTAPATAVLVPLAVLNVRARTRRH